MHAAFWELLMLGGGAGSDPSLQMLVNIHEDPRPSTTPSVLFALRLMG